MGSKNAANARDAGKGAKNQPQGSAPEPDKDPVNQCEPKHWIAVRVEFEDGKLVETGILKTLQLNNGETRNVVLNAGTQAGGKYSTGEILDSTGDCHVCFPDMYDAEITPK